MSVPEPVRAILARYQSDSPGTRANLARILMQGRLGGSGKLVILPVDQGFEHGPARSFAGNPDAYDPLYHYRLAVDAGLSAFAAPLGLLEAGAADFAGTIPTILKINSGTSLAVDRKAPVQALTAEVRDAVRLGCAAVGFTIYPGSERTNDMLEDLRDVIDEARDYSLPVVVWSYPRGGTLSKEGETALDVIAYAAHVACLMGAHIVKVKLPGANIEQSEAMTAYDGAKVPVEPLVERVRHVVQACFAGRRLVVFSGGARAGLEEVYDNARAIREGGGNGSIIGRNTFQRPRAEALTMLAKLTDIYLGKA